MDDEKDWQSECSLQKTNKHMLDTGVCSDITLIMGPDRQPIKAHKFMLVSRSHVFSVMFSGQLAEKGESVTIPDIEADIMKEFLGFLYTEHVELAPDTVMALMYTATKYGVKALVKRCGAYLETEIDSDNVCTILEQAHLFDEPKLINQCFNTIYSKGAEVFTHEVQDYENLSRDCLKTLLQSDKLDAPESTLFRACVVWAESQCRRQGVVINDLNIREMLGETLFLIRFPNMDERVFTELVSVRDILTAEEKLAVYQHYNSSPRDGEVASAGLRFPSRPRNFSDIFRVRRFQETMGGTFDFWDNDNLCDAISFMASRDIVLIGVAVFRPFPDGLIRGSLRLYDECNRCKRKREHLGIFHTKEEKTFDVEFKPPVRMKQNKWYTVTQNMTGAKSYFGIKGEKRVQGEGVTISFRNSPMDTNNTNIETGQISALLYQ